MDAVYSQYAWLIPLFPLLAFVILVSMGRHMKTLGAYTSIIAVAISFVLSILLFAERMSGDVNDYAWNGFTWVAGGEFTLTMGFEINNLNALMLLVVTLVSLLVNIYSKEYMRDDERINVFYAYVSLFTFSMLALVMSENLLQLYIFWELVGVCSFLLIGFWYYKPEAKAAAKKAFIVTRIGDVGLFIAILLLFWYVPNHALDCSSIHNAVETNQIPAGVLTLIALLIFIGAIGKSGQFPLHTWLPDAMEGPTPISALIHAATMVAAGVYLVARTYDVFTPEALTVVAWVGAFTAIFAATIAVAQNDLKRVLAYSTISQLGYMMMAMGIGTAAAYAAGMFHLFTHAFFKALLFLGAGSVIHAIQKQDIREMGGLGKTMKVTMWTFAIGTLALAGLVPFSGFWSKDAILTEAYDHHPALFVVGLIAAFFTAFYMARLFFLVFAGEKRSEYKAQENNGWMTVPLVILAVLAVVSGFVQMPNLPWLGEWLTGASMADHTSWLVIVLSNIVAIAGLLLGWTMYGKKPVAEDPLSAGVPQLYRLLNRKYYIDEIYHALFVVPLRAIGHVLQLIDSYIVAGAVNLVSGTVLLVGKGGRRAQNGQVQTYGLITLLGFIAFVVLIVGRRYFHVG